LTPKSDLKKNDAARQPIKRVGSSRSSRSTAHLMRQRVPDIQPLRSVPVVQIVRRNQIKEEAIRRFGNSRKDRRYLHWVFTKEGNGSKVSVKPGLTQNFP
jgi:hypothetical protein